MRWTTGNGWPLPLKAHMSAITSSASPGYVEDEDLGIKLWSGSSNDGYTITPFRLLMLCHDCNLGEAVFSRRSRFILIGMRGWEDKPAWRRIQILTANHCGCVQAFSHHRHTHLFVDCWIGLCGLVQAWLYYSPPPLALYVFCGMCPLMFV
jgi:hypothetical protein